MLQKIKFLEFSKFGEKFGGLQNNREIFGGLRKYREIFGGSQKQRNISSSIGGADGNRAKTKLRQGSARNLQRSSTAKAVF